MQSLMSSFSLAIRQYVSVGRRWTCQPVGRSDTMWASSPEQGWAWLDGNLHEHHRRLFSHDVDDGKVFRNKLAALSGFKNMTEYDFPITIHWTVTNAAELEWSAVEVQQLDRRVKMSRDRKTAKDKLSGGAAAPWDGSVCAWCTPKATRPVTTRLACGGMRECYSWRQWWSRAQSNMGWCPCLWTGVLPFKAFLHLHCAGKIFL